MSGRYVSCMGTMGSDLNVLQSHCIGYSPVALRGKAPLRPTEASTVLSQSRSTPVDGRYGRDGRGPRPKEMGTRPGGSGGGTVDSTSLASRQYPPNLGIS